MTSAALRRQPDCDPRADADRCAAVLPENPDCTLNVHFGQLLGVDDLRALQGFHLGQARRHQRALHGHGVVTGFAVSVESTPDEVDRAELRVSPGHALDAGGRDLLLSEPQCLSLSRWWAARLLEKDPDYAEFWGRTHARLTLEVVVSYATCLSEPVPAIADPCQRQASDIAYARVCETARLSLRRVAPAGEAEAELPPTGPLPSPLPDDRAGWVAWLAGLPPDAPPGANPNAEAAEATPPVVLARLHGVAFTQVDGQWQASVDAVDMAVRPLLLSTATLQRVLLPGLATPPAVGGPLPLAEGSSASGASVTLVFSQPLAPASVALTAFAVTQFDAAAAAGAGWHSHAVTAVAYAEPDGVPTATLTLAAAVQAGQPVRITLQGSGPTPLMGANGLPLGAPEAQADGRSLSITLT